MENSQVIPWDRDINMCRERSEIPAHNKDVKLNVYIDKGKA